MIEHNRVVVKYSRFRRELKKWMRYLKAHPNDIIYVDRRHGQRGVVVSPEMWQMYQDTLLKLSQ